MTRTHEERLAAALESAEKFRLLSEAVDRLEQHADGHDRAEFESCEICDVELPQQRANYKHMAVDYAQQWALIVTEIAGAKK